MKLLRFKKGTNEYYGMLEGDKVTVIKGDVFSEFERTTEEYNLSDVKILAPCRPSKVVAVGLNYKAHAEEMNDELPQTPKIFLKPSTSVIDPEEDISIPEMSKRVDFEAELAIVIKKKAKNISEEEVKDYVLGYTCLNDVTARDLQSLDGQWTRAKGFDTFCPVGPVVTDEVDPDNVRVRSILNGETKQDSNTNNFIFKTYELVSFISKVMTLNPGDVIATGTPSGIGPMEKGDVIEIQLDGIGILKNYVK